MKKLLVLLGLGGIAYYFAKDRLGGEPDEFVFTEVPAETPPADTPATAAPAPTADDSAATDPVTTETSPETPPTTPPPVV